MAKSDSGRSGRIIRRQRFLLLIALVAVVVCAAGLVAVWQIKSPAEQAVEQSPPPPSVLTAVVRKDILSQQLILRGTVVADTAVVRSMMALSPAVVTDLPKPAGSTVAEGDVIAEISGRPVFVLAGTVPAYRALISGLTGKDVAQVQAALQRLGFLAGGFKDGTFDQATSKAVAAFYASRGYTAACEGTTTQICLGEVAFVPSLPATVASVDVAIGDDPAGAAAGLVSLQLGAVRIAATLPNGQQTGVEAGLPVAVSDDASGRQCQGTVAAVGDYAAASSDGSAVSVAGFPLTVSAGDCLDSSWLNLNVRLVVAVTATAQPVLIVPTAAVQTDASGARYVLVLDAPSSTRRVDVSTGLIAAGEVEVTPATGQSLDVGDQVVTG